MPDYFAQHPAGLGTLIVDALAVSLPDARVSYADDSAVSFNSKLPRDRVAELPFIKNGFQVLTRTRRRDVSAGVDALARAMSQVEVPSGLQHRPFRTMAHIDGELTGINPATRSRLERAVATRTGGRLQPKGACQEFWVIGRRELPDFLLAARLQKPKRPPQAKGALSQALASALVLASKPTATDVFLDAFAGSGALVEARSESLSRRCIYNDLALPHLRDGLSPELISRRVTLLGEDGLQLPSVRDGEVDAIVTDPPWGEFEELPMALDDWANGVAAMFRRVLNPARGRFVLLVSRRSSDVYVERLTGQRLRVTASHELLANGHPTSAIVGTTAGGPERA